MDLANRKIIELQLTTSYNRVFIKYHFIYIANRVLTFTLVTRMEVAALYLACIVFVNAYTSRWFHFDGSKIPPLINTVQDLTDSHKLLMSVRQFTFEY